MIALKGVGRFTNSARRKTDSAAIGKRLSTIRDVDAFNTPAQPHGQTSPVGLSMLSHTIHAKLA